MTSPMTIEDSIIDQVRTLGRPDRQPAQNAKIDFYYLKSTSVPKYL